MLSSKVNTAYEHVQCTLYNPIFLYILNLAVCVLRFNVNAEYKYALIFTGPGALAY